LCARYHADPTFVLASATTSEPAATASRLTGLDVVAVDDDASPRGPATFALWEPPLTELRGEREIGRASCRERVDDSRASASRRRHTRFSRDWSSDVCSSDLCAPATTPTRPSSWPRPPRPSPRPPRPASPDWTSSPSTTTPHRAARRRSRSGNRPSPNCAANARSEERRVGKEWTTRGHPQAEDGIRDFHVTGVQTCALPISVRPLPRRPDLRPGLGHHVRARGHRVPPHRTGRRRRRRRRLTARPGDVRALGTAPHRTARRT